MLKVQENNDIEMSGFHLTKNGISVIGTPTFKQWEHVGKFINRSAQAVQFWRGDWLNYGEHTYDQWSQYFSEDESAYQTLANEKWVASKIPFSRRRENLSWSHHAEVADLEPEDQEAMLSKAETEKLSRASFRKIVRAYKLKLDLQELSESQLLPTDPEVFKKVQEIVESNIHTVELIEEIHWDTVNKDAKDYLLSNIKRTVGFLARILQTYDKQKQIPDSVV